MPMAPGTKRQVDSPQEFYARALTKAERLRLSKAREVEGLDQEIALLRLRLQQLVEKHPDKVELLFKGVNLLLRAVTAKYRLSPKAHDDLAKSIYGVLENVGGAMGLEGFNGGQET